MQKVTVLRRAKHSLAN